MEDSHEEHEAASTHVPTSDVENELADQAVESSLPIGNSGEYEDVPLQDLEHTQEYYSSQITSSPVTVSFPDKDHDSDETSDTTTLDKFAQDSTLPVPSHMTHHDNSQQSAFTPIGGSYSSGFVDAQSQNNSPKIRDRRHGQAQPSTLNPKPKIRTQPSRDDADTAPYHSRPIHVDTEASLGLTMSQAEQLWTAVQNDPNALLARIIKEDLHQIPAIYRTMFVYAAIIIVTHALLACALNGVFGVYGTVILIFLFACMEALQWVDAWNGRCRILRLPRGD